MRLATWLGGVVGTGSWFRMYREITHCHHVKPSLAFNSTIDPVTGLRPHPGLPLILLYIVCVAVPLVVATGWWLSTARVPSLIDAPKTALPLLGPCVVLGLPGFVTAPAPLRTALSSSPE